MNEHERGFLAFLAEPSRGRLGTLLERGDKRRRDLRSMLHHNVRIDPRFGQRLTGSDAFAGTVEVLLNKRGAPPTCYILGGSADGREMPLREALEDIIGMGDGVFVSCIPGQLGFYEYAEMKASYLLSR
jgi:hypothetical protein